MNKVALDKIAVNFQSFLEEYHLDNRLEFLYVFSNEERNLLYNFGKHASVNCTYTTHITWSIQYNQQVVHVVIKPRIGEAHVVDEDFKEIILFTNIQAKRKFLHLLATSGVISALRQELTAEFHNALIDDAYLSIF